MPFELGRMDPRQVTSSQLGAYLPLSNTPHTRISPVDPGLVKRHQARRATLVTGSSRCSSQWQPAARRGRIPMRPRKRPGAVARDQRRSEREARFIPSCSGHRAVLPSIFDYTPDQFRGHTSDGSRALNPRGGTSTGTRRTAVQQQSTATGAYDSASAVHQHAT